MSRAVELYNMLMERDEAKKEDAAQKRTGEAEQRKQPHAAAVPTPGGVVLVTDRLVESAPALRKGPPKLVDDTTPAKRAP